ncbi:MULTISPECIES: GNAT family N-acetyltransferase [Alphaproteobacteria]|uniref:GNAT family N-acetyltransferase n=1 Tax=Alphaproteobacteria TaxID=28211 RepID=UPI001B28A7A9|nr:GNAT family N-acetyltransferase [Maricaulis sp.]MBO6763468.1 GNAT family N-acetyltransferase [Maricaulis sp.]
MTDATDGTVIEVTVARTLDQVVMAMTLRGVIYLGEQEAPYAEEYDGNDLVAASHLIAWKGREPVGVLRLRWFADFAKVERAAVLQQYRRDGVMRVLMQEALRYSARRGYRRVIGHAQLNRVKYWRTHGFRVRPERPEFYFSDYAYVEIERELIPPVNAITADTDPMVLIRPDGEWDRPGPFDLSLERLEAEKEQARKDKKKSEEEAA